MQLARSSELIHPSGIKLQTPLLVPSFSSKGFRFNKDDESEVSKIFDFAREHLTQSLLISAYDAYYKYIPSDEFPTDIVFIDSGGYETSNEHDLSEVFRYIGPIKEWNSELHSDYLSGWQSYISAVIISFDHGQIRNSLEEQIGNAIELFNSHKDQLNDILIKPETKEQQYIPVKKIIDNIKLLNGFDIIGFTEKELGGSLLLRMQNITELRLALDEAKIESPIHIFGSLDPITSILYFLSGAEIFDGLTWLKYAYNSGMAIYKHNYGALNCHLSQRDQTLDPTVWTKNIFYLEDLQLQMRNFLLENEFSMFKDHSTFLKNAYDNLCGKLGRRL